MQGVTVSYPPLVVAPAIAGCMDASRDRVTSVVPAATSLRPSYATPVGQRWF